MKIELDDPSYVNLLKAACISAANGLRRADLAAGISPMRNPQTEFLLQVAAQARYVDPRKSWTEAGDYDTALADEEYESSTELLFLRKQAE